MTEQGFPAGEIDTSRPHPARMYDYYLGGKDNYEVDREAADRVVDAVPEVVVGARANRDFLQRAVRYLAEHGVRQFIDIGTGIPTSPNTHEIAHSVAPDARIAYIDNDPIVATHAGARLLGTGNTGFFLADMRDPQTILNHPTIRELIDFGQPVALMLVSVLHFVTDEENPRETVATLRDAMPEGSYLVLSHATADFNAGKADEVTTVYKKATALLTPRTHAEVLDLFGGFELVEPGLVQVNHWRNEVPEDTPPVGVYGAIGRRR
ncbi:hypothetical protein RVR_8561 [Actinacidiphila reveromycinica]|uniref:S-adenosyl methyltransferase n=1 Tax=Actinacidiphila reveromycinica TaxID=659352 RepID=A0A7U3UVY7_9ACTN|nr:SAM-dependent methyltransferase [Streptomyces sp. SN-593]BBB01251.1 hypothetical protein RVR_8561 [Streptomyces sp. SN-593]